MKKKTISSMQLTLWEEEAPRHLIEVIYRDGKKQLLDTSNPDHERAFRDMNVVSAGFVSRQEAIRE